MDWALLIAGAGVAGWIDAVIGGGGLVLIPLLLAVMPGLAPAAALATNKVAAVAGTASAAVTLVRKVKPPRAELLRMAPVAALCSGAGALAAALMDAAVMRPLIIALMLAVGVFVAFKPNFGTTQSLGLRGGWRTWAALVAVAAIAFYDGIFGPGTGMFLIMAFTAIFSQNFLRSAAMAKVVNTCTNLGALVVFIAGGHVWWSLAVVLAAANVVGAQLGARTVIGGGAKLIRFALLAVVVVMSCYLAFIQWG
ncbi:membrane protein [Corynebacterium phocae]|uniref:Probable membrane transporter protein n=1 Tax=Corynebacterium phocae TaxID=161895 RepID=A0A1L7D0K5_9CORY|nr:TSUP family transporter [Corynebacterium phocae]APT91634.1 membrane protein [Corynebacterium phocae]KAA8720712.1 TSUP family transporter [Corynebacterium phocae]